MMPPEITLILSNLRHRIISYRNELPYDTVWTTRVYQDGKRKRKQLFDTWFINRDHKDEYKRLVLIFGNNEEIIRSQNFVHWFKTTVPNEQAI